MSLADFTTRELEAEIQRRRDNPEPQQPAGTCKRCGESWWYHGEFKAWRFEQLAKAFQIAHAFCPLCVNGGGI